MNNAIKMFHPSCKMGFISCESKYVICYVSPLSLFLFSFVWSVYKLAIKRKRNQQKINHLKFVSFCTTTLKCVNSGSQRAVGIKIQASVCVVFCTSEYLFLSYYGHWNLFTLCGVFLLVYYRILFSSKNGAPSLEYWPITQRILPELDARRFPIHS